MDLANLLKYQVLPLLLSQTILALNSLLANSNYPFFKKKKETNTCGSTISLILRGLSSLFAFFCPTALLSLVFSKKDSPPSSPKSTQIRQPAGETTGELQANDRSLKNKQVNAGLTSDDDSTSIRPVTDKPVYMVWLTTLPWKESVSTAPVWTTEGRFKLLLLFLANSMRIFPFSSSRSHTFLEQLQFAHYVNNYVHGEHFIIL